MQRKRWAVAGTALALITLAACGGSGDSGGESGGGGGDDATRPIKIGVYGPFTIEQGKDARDAAILAAEEVETKLGRKVEIVTCDTVDGAQPDKAVACATRFIESDNVDAIVGGFSSGETLAMLDTVVKGEIPYVSTGAAAPDVVKDVSSGGERRFIFRIGPINSNFLAADMCTTYVTQLAPQAGFKKFGILWEDVEAFRPLESFLKACLANPKAASAGKIPVEKGVEVVLSEKHAADAQDFSTQFSNLEKAGAEFVIEINSRSEGTALAKQWGTLKPKFALGGINVTGQRLAHFKATDGKAAYELVGPSSAVRSNTQNPLVKPYFEAFNKKFGRDPIYTGAAAYDGVYAIAEAAKTAGSLQPDDLVAALEKMDRMGVQGVERFDNRHDIQYGAGDPTKGVVPVYTQWTPDGQQQPAFPKVYAGNYQYKKPPWIS